MKKTMEELERLSPSDFKNAGKSGIIVLLDNLRSGSNVGSIFRSADSFCIEKIWCCGYTPLPPHREILKTALGATETVQWEHCTKTIDLVREMREMGILVYAVEQVHGSAALQHFSWPTDKSIALVLGNEVSGVDDDVIAACNGSIEIEQYGSKHSLNVAVCAGIVLYDLSRKLRG
jgi:tRNA G18 (ribose-2'-O)-methylase SpoU